MTSIVSLVTSGGIIRRGQHGARVFAVQRVLLNSGADLVADSDFGVITESAVEAWQARHKLTADGQVGLMTATAMDDVTPAEASRPTDAPKPSVLKVAPWLSVARALTGTKEFPGSRDNPLIIAWAKEIGGKYPDIKPNVAWYNHDSIAWCGLFQAICLTRCDVKPPLAPLGAGGFGPPWGQKVTTPSPGVFFVYSRTGGHHVTQYESEDATYYYCRGGNQSDQANVTRIPKSRPVQAMRWPAGIPLPTAGRKYGATANFVATATES